jgi:hypothetical protein
MDGVDSSVRSIDKVLDEPDDERRLVELHPVSALCGCHVTAAG